MQYIGVIVLTLMFWKLIQKKNYAEMGLINIKLGYKNLIKGLLIGCISITIVFITLLYSKNLKSGNLLVNDVDSINNLKNIIIFICIGFSEEVLFRGLILSNLKQMYKNSVAIGVASGIFALMHGFNSGICVLGYINLFIAGVLFSYMVIKSKNLWFPIGYHITWNYFEGAIFGFKVSGINVKSIYTIKSLQDNVLTGGRFGPEGGLIVTIVLFLGLIYTWKFIDCSKHG